MMGWGGGGTPALTVLSTDYYIKIRNCFLGGLNVSVDKTKLRLDLISGARKKFD